MMDGGECSACPIGQPFNCMDIITSTTLPKQNENKKRFSAQQIRSLESMFESESRLEPRKMVQLAEELGLQPRQVAIWFQNKRARWKSKLLERDYNILRANYNNLASRFEILKKEKQALLVQLQKLNELIQKPAEEVHCSGEGVSVTSSEGESKNGDRARCEPDTKPNLSLEKSDHGGLGVISEEDSSINAQYLGLKKDAHLVSMVEPADGSMASQEDWRRMDSDGLFDQPNTEYQWWDFWP